MVVRARAGPARRAGGARGAAEKVVGGATGAAEKVVGGATGAAEKVVGGATGAAEKVVGGATGAAEKVVGGATGAAEKVVVGATGAAEKVVVGATGAAEKVVGGATGAAEKVVGGATGAAESVAPAAGAGGHRRQAAGPSRPVIPRGAALLVAGQRRSPATTSGAPVGRVLVVTAGASVLAASRPTGTVGRPVHRGPACRSDSRTRRVRRWRGAERQRAGRPGIRVRLSAPPWPAPGVPRPIPPRH